MLISKSMMNTFKTCPLCFKYKYIDHRFPDTVKSELTLIGTAIHELFHDFFDHVRVDEIPGDEPYDYFVNVMQVPIHFRGIFREFCRFESERWKKYGREYWMPVLREQEIIHDNLIGIIDRVDYDGEEYTVIDYKGSISNISAIRFELYMYKHILDASGRLDKPVKYIASYAYRTGQFFKEECRDWLYERAMEKINAFREIDFDNIEYEKREGYHCRWCEYRRACQNDGI